MNEQKTGGEAGDDRAAESAPAAEPDRRLYGDDGKCRPHGNPWRCPRCLADVSDVTVFNNL